MTEAEQIKQFFDALRPKVPGAHWSKSLKKARKTSHLAYDSHGYTLGRISDIDTEITADETWLVASGAKDFPRLNPKMVFRVEVAPTGTTRLAVTVLIKGPPHTGDSKWGPTQAVLDPGVFVGKSFRIAQMPRRDGWRVVLRETLQTRVCKQNAARWIEIDRPLDNVGPDLVAAFGDSSFGK